MTIKCAFCGKPFTYYDGWNRKYCPECQRSGHRYAVQFRERQKNDPILKIHVANYSKRHGLYKKGKMSKEALDAWRYESNVKRYQVSAGDITIDKYKTWCDETYPHARPKRASIAEADSESVTENVRERIYPLATPSYLFVGRKPIAILFGDERVTVKSWKDVYTTILKRCNDDPIHHETLMNLRGKIAGKCRIFLSDSPTGMKSPIRIDEDMYVESHYGSATLIHILTVRILKPVRFDYSKISVVLKD